MTKHTEVVRMWLGSSKSTGSRMFTDGRTIYSYGEHFPIATFISHNKVLFNIDTYSSSTSTHQNYVMQALTTSMVGYEIIRCTTNDITAYLRNPDHPIVLRETVQPKDFNGLLEVIEKYFKSKGIKRYPKKDVHEFLVQKIVAKLV